MIDVMKRAAMEAVDDAKPCDLRYGTVVSTNPLSVRVTADFTIPKSLLVVPQHLTKYTVSMTMSGSTGEPVLSDEEGGSGGGSTGAELPPHTHSIGGTRTITINNALRVGDKVVLIRKSGGNSYLVFDRV
jgi:hypothetical protein